MFWILVFNYSPLNIVQYKLMQGNGALHIYKIIVFLSKTNPSI
jgi:hypothetical protein